MHARTTHDKIKTGGLCHIAIDVSDLDASITFYIDMFEMDIVSRSDKIAHLKTSGKDDSFFLFQADGKVNPKACGMTHAHFGFKIDDQNFEKALAYIKKNEIKIHHNPARGTGKFVYIEDPDGYVIQLEPDPEGHCGG
jgi:catechol 2,3-dioxygenase-like lactoylglutathione lyase family enzyme